MRLALLALPVAALAQCAPECAPASPATTVEWVAGDCSSFAEEAAAVGLPWDTFSRIAWRESGCDPNAWVHDHDDWGGGLFGLNFISQDLRNGWMNLCGATRDTIRGDVPLQMQCAKAAYDRMGMQPWRTG